MKRISCLALLTLATVATAAQTPSPKVLKAIPSNIQWGHYDANAKPVINVKSGETIRVETVSGNPDVLTRLGAPDDDNLKELKIIYAEVKDRGPGPHLLTGPIGVEGAEPGNVLQVDILEIHPRSSYGYNVFGPTAGILLDEFPYAKQKLIPLDTSRLVSATAAVAKTYPPRHY